MDKPLGPPPAELKALVPFVQRANELRVADQVVAYWCCYYAAQLGITANATGKDAKLYLLDLMDTLEALKSQLSDNDAVINDAASSAYVENFALKVFVGADNEDRAGKATRGTAKNFLIASQFLELLKIFGSIDAEMQEKIRYAKWKAADIAKAFKEGRTPQAGPAGGDDKVDAAGIESAIAMQSADSKAEDEYLAREMAKLVAPGSPAALSALSPPSMSRSPSASKARLSVDGGAVSPNFSKPLQPQLPRSSSFGQADESTMSLPAPEEAAAGEEADTWNHAVMGQGSLAANTDRDGNDMFPRSPDNAPTNARPMPDYQHDLPSTPSNVPSSSGTQAPGPGIAPPSFWAASDAEAHDASALPSVPSDMPDATSALDHPAIQRIDPERPDFGTKPPSDSPAFQHPSAPSAPDFSNIPPSAARTRPSAPSYPSQSVAAQPPSQRAQQASIVAAAQSTPMLTENFPEALSAKLSTRVQKLAKGAASAVDFEDLDTARIQLRQALDILEGRVTK